jgi:hypothetical protein
MITNDENQMLVITDTSDIDVLDGSLYSYDTAVFSLSAIQHRTAETLLDRVTQFINSVPVLNQVKEKLTAKQDFVPWFDSNILDGIKKDIYKFQKAKDKDGYRYLHFKSSQTFSHLPAAKKQK